jgi:hypothetical protein
MWQLMSMVCNQDKSDLEERKVMEEKKMDLVLIKHIMIMTKMQEVDSYFNLDAGSTDSAKAERLYEKFCDDLEQIANEELHHSEFPSVPQLPTEDERCKKQFEPTVLNCMKNFY